MPLPAAPSRSAGVSSKARSAVEDEFSPSFSSSRVTAKPSAPGAPRRTGVMRSPSRAKTRNVDACEPLVIHCLAPVMRPSASACASRSRPEPEPGLGQRERAELLAPAASAGPCPVGAVGEQRQRARARVHRDRHADAGVGARELLEHEHVGEEVRARAAVLLGHADAHQPELAELGEDLAREVVLAVPRGRVRGDPARRRSARASERISCCSSVSSCRLMRAHRWSAAARAEPPTAAPPPSAAAPPRSRRPEAVEAQDLPALLARDPRELRVRG